MSSFRVKIKRCRYFLMAVFVMLTVAGKAETYYVSNTGNDANPGTSESQPWRSLQKVNSFTPSPGDKILFKRGDEWSGTINVRASGTSGSPIVYGAYGSGEKPQIFGSEKITGWTLHSGNIYKASISKPVSQIFIGEEKAKVARYPNSGYHYVSSVQSSTTFTCKELDGSINYAGANWIGRTITWALYTKTVTSSSSTSLTLNSAPAYELGVDEGFYLTNKLEFLDQPGEWYYSSSTNTVYFWTPNGDSPSNYEVRGATIADGIVINDKDYVVIENMEILHSADKAIESTNSSYVTLTNNSLMHPVNYGIYLNNCSSGKYTQNFITGPIIAGINGLSSSNSDFSDNKIYNIGVMDELGIRGFVTNWAGNAIHVIGDNNTFRYNRIIGSGYNGISWRGINATIEYNYLKDICTTIDDGGAIYTYNTDYAKPGSAGSKVRYNIIDGVMGNPEGYTIGRPTAIGIYMDERTHDVIIEHNTVANTIIGIFLHDTGEIDVLNNKVFNSGAMMYITGTYGGNVIRSNTFMNIGKTKYADGSPARIFLINSNKSSTAEADLNRFIDHHRSNPFYNLNGYRYISFNDWKSLMGLDKNSSFDNSGLADGELERIFYNDSKQPKSIDLGTTTYKDINGTKVTGSLALEAFTSKILIQTSPGGITNSVPQINNQSFTVQGEKLQGKIIGKVIANDADADQLLEYKIEQGNEDGLFAINSSTGDITANALIAGTTNISYSLVVSVTDNYTTPASASALVTINLVADGSTTDPGGPEVVATYSEYLFEEASGTQVVDNVASNDGIIYNEQLRTDGVKGSGLQFTGSGYISLGQVFGGNVQNEVTLSAWINPSATSGDYQGIIMHGGPNIDTYALYIKPDSKELAFKTTGTSSEWNPVTNITNLWDGNWHHVAVTYNGAEKVFYIDGTPIANYACTGTIDSGEGYNLLIAAGRDDATPGLLYEGLLDEVRIYNYGLTASEVAELYNQINTGDSTVYFTEEISICDGDSYQGWTSTGQYQRILTSSSGADSIVTTNLTVKPVFNVTENIVISAGEDYLGWTESGQYERTLTSSFGCDSTVVTYLTVEEEATSDYFTPVWEGTNGFNHMSLNVLSAFTYGMPLQAGDEIAVFDGELCVGMVKLTEPIDSLKSTSYIQIKVSQDDGSNNGFTNGNDITFRIWDSLNKVEEIVNQVNYHDEQVTWETSGKFVADGTSFVDLEVVEVIKPITQSIRLNRGWNIFSACVVPEDLGMDAVTQMLLDNNSLVKVQDETGNTYEKWTGKTGWVNNIGEIRSSEGYKIRVKTDCELQVTGLPVQLPLNINLVKGWNIISFPQMGEADALEVLQPVVDAGILLKVQDESGNSIEMWNTETGWVNNVGNFRAGEGYLVNVDSDGVLPIVNSYSKSGLFDPYSPETVYFNADFEGNGVGHMNINIVDLNENGFMAGDEIAAFDGEVCVGTVKLTERHINNNMVTLNASLSDSDVINGFLDGNPVDLVTWSSKTGSELTQDPVVLNGNLVYQKYSSVLVKLNNRLSESPDFRDINIDIYPNPVVDRLTLRFSDIPDGGRITVSDLNGKLIIMREVQSTNETLDMGHYPNGIYLVKIISGDKYQVTKIIKN